MSSTRESFVEGGLSYAFRLPKAYDPEEGTYPLILSNTAIPPVLSGFSSTDLS